MKTYIITKTLYIPVKVDNISLTILQEFQLNMFKIFHCINDVIKIKCIKQKYSDLKGRRFKNDKTMHWEFSKLKR